MLVICNPKSNKDFKILHNIIHCLPVPDPNIRVVRLTGDAARFAEEEISRKEEIITVIGDDKTISEVLPVVAFTKTKLAIIPIGSGNTIARHLKIPIKPKVAIQAILKQQTRTIDIMKIKEKYFIMTFELGFSNCTSEDFEISRFFEKVGKIFKFDPFLFSLNEGEEKIIDGKILYFRLTSRSKNRFEMNLIGNGIRPLKLLFVQPETRLKEIKNISFSNDRDLPAKVDGNPFILPKGNHKIEVIPNALCLI